MEKEELPEAFELCSFWVLMSFPEGWHFHLSLERPESYRSFSSRQNSLPGWKLTHRHPGSSLGQWKFAVEGDYSALFPSFASVLLFAMTWGERFCSIIHSSHEVWPCHSLKQWSQVAIDWYLQSSEPEVTCLFRYWLSWGVRYSDRALTNIETRSQLGQGQ